MEVYEIKADLQGTTANYFKSSKYVNNVNIFLSNDLMQRE